MNIYNTKLPNYLRNRVPSIFKSGFTFRRAMILSISLHIIGIAAVASISISKHLMLPVSKAIKVELELIDENTWDHQRVTYSSNPVSHLSHISSKGESSSIKDSPLNKEEIMMSAFNKLSELKESFNFIMQPIKADSASKIAPIQGIAPDITSIIAGLNSGKDFGMRGRGIINTGGGGGNCPPRGGGGILK